MGDSRLAIDLGQTLLRLWRLYAWMDFTWITRNRTFFVAFLISDLTVTVMGASTVFLLVERFDGIGAWTKPQLLFMLGYGILVRGIIQTFFSFNVATISRRIGRGQLDHLLIQPQPLWVGFLTDGFTPFSGSGSLVLGVVLLIWSGSGLDLAATPGWLVTLGVNLLASVAVVLAFSFLWGSLAFWAPRAAEEISSSALRMLDQLHSFPLDALGPVLLTGLLSAVPVGFVAWYPCRALLGIDPRPYSGAVTPFAAVILSVGATLIFRKGMRQYGRTGSQRYDALGHRR